MLVDYDNGVVSQALQAAYQRMRGNSFPTLESVNAADYPTEQSLINEVCQNRHIYAVVYTHAGASDRLSAAIGGGSAAATYNASNAISFIWNGVRYNTFGQSLVAANLQQLITASGVAYASLNNSYAYSAINTSSPQAITALAQPFRPSSIDIMPTSQGSRVFYNSVTIVMTIISQFFFVLSINGIAGSFQMFTRLSIIRNLYVRWGSAIVYSAGLAATLTGVIWAFRESWPVTASQGVETWLMFTFICNIHFLILDFAAGFIPMRFVPFFVLTWVLMNVTSTVIPFELMPGFYHWQYALPSFEAYSLLITIWSHGCVPQLFRALPILFTWWILGLLGSWVSMIQKCNAATHIERAEEEQVAEIEQEAEEDAEKTLEESSTANSDAQVPTQSTPNTLTKPRTLSRAYDSFTSGDSRGALWMSTPLPFQDRLGLTPARTAPAGRVGRRPGMNERGESRNGVDA
ncbi:hypothetical protein ES702_00592 [subsurface metagenome]